MTNAAQSITLESNRIAQSVCGPLNEILSHLQNATKTEIDIRGNEVRVSGGEFGTQMALHIIGNLAKRAKRNEEITLDVLEGEVKLYNNPAFDRTSTTPAPVAEDDAGSETRQGFQLKKGFIEARTKTQIHYLAALSSRPMVFGVGPAGTGKTFLAVAKAVELFEKGVVKRIIITRPAVEAGEKLGFLPGDQKDKVDPYMQPVYDALRECMGVEQYSKYMGIMPDGTRQATMTDRSIEIAPVAFMRGRTLSNAAIIVDEAQNLTATQMKMVLTRMGKNSVMFITGDPEQCDLDVRVESGLTHAKRILNDLNEISFVQFNTGDVVRHPLVGRILDAYAKDKARD
ncbi:MAG: PhoH family protein [Pseudomonadota bacterium]